MRCGRFSCERLVGRPSGEFAPAGDLLSWTPKKVGKEAAPAAWPLRGSLWCSAFLGSRRTHFVRYAHYAQTTARSQSLKSLRDAQKTFRSSPMQKGGYRPRLATRRLGLQPTWRSARSADAHRGDVKRAVAAAGTQSRLGLTNSAKLAQVNATHCSEGPQP